MEKKKKQTHIVLLLLLTQLKKKIILILCNQNGFEIQSKYMTENQGFVYHLLGTFFYSDLQEITVFIVFCLYTNSLSHGFKRPEYCCCKYMELILYPSYFYQSFRITDVSSGN